MSTMFKEKVCQIGHKLGDMTNSDWIIENSFHVCGIITNNPGKVRNGELLKKIMNSVTDKLADGEELLEDEDPFSCV